MVTVMKAEEIHIDGLTKRFGEVTALDSVELRVEKGAFLVLLGPSGCGKTTLLRLLAGLETPTSGAIWFGDRCVSSPTSQAPPRDRNVGLVFQSYALWPHMTVRQNVEWPLKVAGMAKSERSQRRQEVLEMLNVPELADRYPSEISGGQQQRIALARTLAPEPGVLLFDEPLSNLDAKLRVEMRSELLRVHRMTGATSVYVTHDQVEALTMATQLAVLDRGTLQQQGTPESLLAEPQTPFVARFLGTPPANLLPVEDGTGVVEVEGVTVVSGLDPGAEQVMYRPTSIALTDRVGDRTVPVEVLEVAPLVGRFVLTCQTASGIRLGIVKDDAPDPYGEHFVSFPSSPDAVFPRHS